jgi:hypothetical protein
MNSNLHANLAYFLTMLTSYLNCRATVEKKICEKSDPLCKKIDPKKFKKTDIRFEFLDPDYPSVNPYRKTFFCEKSDPLCKKIDPKKF